MNGVGGSKRVRFHLPMLHVLFNGAVLVGLVGWYLRGCLAKLLVGRVL